MKMTLETPKASVLYPRTSIALWIVNAAIQFLKCKGETKEAKKGAQKLPQEKASFYQPTWAVKASENSQSHTLIGSHLEGGILSF